MAKKTRNKLDFNQLARKIVDQATSDEPAPTLRAARTKAEKAKDPVAVAHGRKGGLKGGKARAKKLTRAQLSESARKAANARWKKPT